MHANDDVRFSEDLRHFARRLFWKLATGFQNHPPTGFVAKSAVEKSKAVRRERAQLGRTAVGHGHIGDHKKKSQSKFLSLRLFYAYNLVRMTSTRITAVRFLGVAPASRFPGRATHTTFFSPLHWSLSSASLRLRLCLLLLFFLFFLCSRSLGSSVLSVTAQARATWYIQESKIHMMLIWIPLQQTLTTLRNIPTNQVNYAWPIKSSNCSVIR